jgi:predicted MPP superfamily phosphohydrolase
MNIITTQVNIGADAPFRLLHISDTHLTLADSRDDERKLKLAESRLRHFKDAETLLGEAERYAREHNLLIVHTGDLIDFVSEANLDRVRKFTDENDVFFAAGNHEFSLYVGEAFEDAEYRSRSLAHVQESFKKDIRFSSRKINGINLVAIDNSYYRFEREQYDALRAEIAIGMPIVLFFHAPLYEPVLYEISMSRGECAYLTSTPDELMKSYSVYRYRQQKADEITLETTELIKSEPLIKAIFTGHMHYDHEGLVTDLLPQYVTGIYTGRVIEIS